MILLALSLDHGRSATPAGQAQVSSMIPTSQNHNTRSTYTNLPIFLVHKNTKDVTKRHSFYYYRLYANTVPLNTQF